MRCLPGNHDMGGGSGKVALDDAPLASYQRRFGPDHWSAVVGRSQLVGINAQRLGSETPKELSTP